MKHCTTCGTNFVDDDLRYCTDDGTVLLAGENPFPQDAQATKIFPDSPPTTVMSTPRPTEYGVRTPADQPPAAPLYGWANEAPAAWTPPAPPAYPSAGQQQQQTTAALTDFWNSCVYHWLVMPRNPTWTRGGHTWAGRTVSGKERPGKIWW